MAVLDVHTFLEFDAGSDLPPPQAQFLKLRGAGSCYRAGEVHMEAPAPNRRFPKLVILFSKCRYQRAHTYFRLPRPPCKI